MKAGVHQQQCNQGQDRGFHICDCTNIVCCCISGTSRPQCTPVTQAVAAMQCEPCVARHLTVIWAWWCMTKGMETHPAPDRAQQGDEQVLLLHQILLQLPHGSMTSHKLASQARIVALKRPLCLKDTHTHTHTTSQQCIHAPANLSVGMCRYLHEYCVKCSNWKPCRAK